MAGESRAAAQFAPQSHILSKGALGRHRQNWVTTAKQSIKAVTLSPCFVTDNKGRKLLQLAALGMSEDVVLALLPADAPRLDT